MGEKKRWKIERTDYTDDSSDERESVAEISDRIDKRARKLRDETI